MEGIKKDEGKLPMAVVLQTQFPRALQAIAENSEFGHRKYKDVDSDYLNYQRIDDGFFRYSNAMIRHFFAEKGDCSGIDKDNELPHIYATAWNALARLELYLKQKENGNK